MRALFGDLQATVHSQARAVLRAGDVLEQLTGQLGSPNFLAASDQGFAQRMQVLQAEMLDCINRLRNSLLGMLTSVAHDRRSLEQAF